jgi:hypothetical protein
VFPEGSLFVGFDKIGKNAVRSDLTTASCSSDGMSTPIPIALPLPCFWQSFWQRKKLSPILGRDFRSHTTKLKQPLSL